METVFESDSIRYVRVTEELVKDYLAMVNDIQRVARFIGDRTEAIPEEKELSWIRMPCGTSSAPASLSIWLRP